MPEPTRPDDKTREAGREDARAAHEPDREPTPDEEARAEEQDVSEETREAYEEMAEKGAETEGEGRLP
ncbi:MAG: hypothetical protein U5R31_17805 [Acidimicrobiia bacterium]|nr:hypothetical protein [Acidimicrobiia bacterium]